MQAETAQAIAMLEAFGSAGASRFDLTITTQDGTLHQFRRGLLGEALLAMLPEALVEAEAQHRNLIIRPHGEHIAFVQLDDLDLAQRWRIDPVALLTLETSPGNFQAWLAMPPEEAEDDFIRRLRRGVGADPTASGATRLAGSRNFKDRHAPAFPTIALVAVQLGRITNRVAVEALQLVESAPVRAETKPYRPRRSGSRGHGRGWPSYERCLQGAPPTRGGDACDTSRADFTWCMIASSWGWPTTQIAARLLTLSEKAKENGERYATLTAEKAAEAAARNAMSANPSVKPR
jgi:hypothetical protein